MSAHAPQTLKMSRNRRTDGFTFGDYRALPSLPCLENV